MAIDCAAILRVLADPTRLKVVEVLLAGGPQRVGEINTQLGIEPTLLSHHLRVLRDSGLVSGRRVGKTVVYRLDCKVRGGKVPGIDLGCCRLSFDGAR